MLYARYVDGAHWRMPHMYDTCVGKMYTFKSCGADAPTGAGGADGVAVMSLKSSSPPAHTLLTTSISAPSRTTPLSSPPPLLLPCCEAAPPLPLIWCCVWRSLLLLPLLLACLSTTQVQSLQLAGVRCTASDREDTQLLSHQQIQAWVTIQTMQYSREHCETLHTHAQTTTTYPHGMQCLPLAHVQQVQGAAVAHGITANDALSPSVTQSSANRIGVSKAGLNCVRRRGCCHCCRWQGQLDCVLSCSTSARHACHYAQQFWIQ
jgi:hypothetical protein